MSELDKLIDLLKRAIEAGQTFTLGADEVTVKIGPSDQGNVGQTGIEVTISNPAISTEA